MKPVFIILNGIGVTIGLPPEETLQVHLVDLRELGMFNMPELSSSVFLGQLRAEAAALAAFDPKPGRKVRLYNHETGYYSNPLVVEAVFYQPEIHKLVKPDVFVPFISSLKDVTTHHEFTFYTDIVKSLFGVAADAGSYEVNFNHVMEKAGFVAHETFMNWLSELVDVGLVEFSTEDTLRICDPLIYLVMSAVNRTQPGTFIH